MPAFLFSKVGVSKLNTSAVLKSIIGIDNIITQWEKRRELYG
jgi:hypothetical protein